MDLLNQPHYFDEIKNDILLMYHKGTNYHNTYHKHNGYEIYLFLRGNINLLIEHSCFHLEKGNLAIMNPSEYHLAVSLDDSVYERITLNVTPSILRNLSTNSTNLISFFDNRKPGTNNVISLSEKELDSILILFQNLNAALTSHEFGSDLLAHSYLAQIFYMVCSSYIASESIPVNIMPPLISHTIQFVEEHLSESFTLADLGCALNFNSSYLSRLFKKYTGINLKKYILEKKISLAQSLLLEGYSVTDTCYNAGFKDYANFIRTFKQYTGKTPGSLKKGKL